MFDTKQPSTRRKASRPRIQKLNCNQPITKPNCHTTMPTASQIEALLPQTQCRQCGYDGCAPYAQAITQGQAPINLCPPGGDIVLHELAELLHIPPLPLAQPARKLLAETRAIPLIKRGNRLSVLLSDPTDPQAIELASARLERFGQSLARLSEVLTGETALRGLK